MNKANNPTNNCSNDLNVEQITKQLQENNIIDKESAHKLVLEDFVKCDFNDKRLTARVINMASEFFRNTGSIVCKTFDSSAQIKGAYGFLKNTKINQNNIQAPHMNNTIRKINEIDETVLLIQDTTYIMPGTQKPFQGKSSYIGKTSCGDPIYGFALHSCSALSESGVPLGLFTQYMFEHDSKKPISMVNEEDGDRELAHKKSAQRTIEQKESYRWLVPLQNAKAKLLRSNVVHIADRESDIYEILAYAVQNKQQAIIRSSHNRKVAVKREGLFDPAIISMEEALQSVDYSYEFKTEIYNQETEKHEDRSIGIKLTTITIISPNKSIDPKTPKHISVNVMEIKSLDDLPLVHWKLLTTMQTTSFEDALRIINLYKKRWNIENYHKVLKTTFKAEDVRLEEKERIINLLSIISILAVKFYYLMHLSRVAPDTPSDQVLEKEEWQALLVITKKTSILDVHKVPPPKIGEAIAMIAKLGGHMGRKNDKVPGILVIWRGWARLSNMALYHKHILSTFSVN